MKPVYNLRRKPPVLDRIRCEPRSAASLSCIFVPSQFFHEPLLRRQNLALFLEYELARILHDKHPGSIWTPATQATYDRLKEDVESASDIDLEIETSLALNTI